MTASIVIVADDTHFKCVKNRYMDGYEYEKIPLPLLPAYLTRFKEYFTVEDLMCALVYEMTS